jgi:hypothetical protein
VLWRRSPVTPLTIPPLALGLGILMLFNIAGAGLSFGGLLAGHMALCVLFAFMNSFDNVALSLFLSGGRARRGAADPALAYHRGQSGCARRGRVRTADCGTFNEH